MRHPAETHSPKNNHLLLAQEVARLLRLGLSTIYSWAGAGKIPHVRVNGVIRFRREDLEEWLRDHGRCPSKSPSPSNWSHPVTEPAPLSPGAMRRTGEKLVRRFVREHKAPSGPRKWRDRTPLHQSALRKRVP